MKLNSEIIYLEWKPKWVAGDKLKVCNHQSGVHREKVMSKATFCNDCGSLIAYSQPKDETPQYVFDRKREPVILVLDKEEVNQILKHLRRKLI